MKFTMAVQTSDDTENNSVLRSDQEIDICAVCFKALLSRRGVRVVALCGCVLATARSVACFAAVQSTKQTVVAELETEQSDRRNSTVVCPNESY